MSDQRAYGSPAAFRRALTDKLRDKARSGRWTLPQLQRQIAYDRLLQRLYTVDQGWVVKGAVALLTRDLGVRATVDIDIYREVEREVAEADLRDAAAQDIGDWFRFQVGAGRPIGNGARGVRLPVTASIGPAVWAECHVDLVGSDGRMTGEPDDVPPLARVVMPDVEQHGYRAYPLVDHIADKFAAILQRYGDLQMPSTRFKDLVDLVAIVTEASVEADAVKVALTSEADRRGIMLPETFDVPDRRLWELGYAAEARRSLLPAAHSLAEALAAVGAFVDPLLDGTASGLWDPGTHRWAPSA
jgi:hypothetical protein